MPAVMNAWVVQILSVCSC